MANIKEYKLNTVEKIKSRLQDARAIVLIDYKGINVAEVNKLRDNFRAEKVDYFVAKNTWIQIALHQLNINTLDKYLVGTTAIAVSKNDEVSPAKVMKKFRETDLDKKDICAFKVGLVGDTLFDSNQLNQLAELPSKPELIAKVLYGFNAPLQGFVGVLSGVIRKFVLVTDAIAKQKAEQN